MYNPAHFQSADRDTLHAFIQAHPLGSLVRQGPQGLDADHIPFELAPEEGEWGTLRAHVARANPLWQELQIGLPLPMLLIFHGPQGYISPSWYPSKHETHRQVPTWNYQVVHAHGLLRVQDEERFVRGLVARLTRHHERHEPRPWKMGDAPPDYINDMLSKVVGIEVQITRLEGKFKLSQNKETRDQAGAAQTLSERGHEALSAAMGSKLRHSS